MKILHYNCVSGISGDMNLSALIDMGVDETKLVSELRKLNIDGWHLSSAKAQKQGIWGTQVSILCAGGTTDLSDTSNHQHHCNHSHDSGHCCQEHSHNHKHDTSEHCCCGGHKHHHSDGEHHHTHHHGRSFADIKSMLLQSTLSDFVKEKSIKIFQILAKAEAFIHNKSIDDVHFHEVGAVDSIIDIVGSAICLEILGVEKITVGSIELGAGVVKCAHGLMPVPAPATAGLATGFVCSVGGVNHEATTPTGMAFLSALAENSSQPKGKIIARGIGIGQRDCSERANVLQVILLDSNECSNSEKMFVVSTNIDDMTSEAVSHLCSKLFDAGAVDVWQQSITMKKSRMAVQVSALVCSEKLSELENVFFKHSTTLGFRIVEVLRKKLGRENIEFKSSLGNVRIKCADGKIKAEFEDIVKLTNSTNLSFLEVKERVETEFKNQ